MIHFRPLALLFIRPIVSTERAVVYWNLLYDPRGQNDPRNRALDDQLDRLRWREFTNYQKKNC